MSDLGTLGAYSVSSMSGALNAGPQIQATVISRSVVGGQLSLQDEFVTRRTTLRTHTALSVTPAPPLSWIEWPKLVPDYKELTGIVTLAAGLLVLGVHVGGAALPVIVSAAVWLIYRLRDVYPRDG